MSTRTGSRTKWRAAFFAAVTGTALLTAPVAAGSTTGATPTPVAHWAFDDGSGSTAADSSGHDHPLTLGPGASWSGPAVGSGSMAVNGTVTGNATMPTPIVDTAASFTVSAWVNLNSISGYQTVVSIDGTQVSGFYLQLRADTGKFAFTRPAVDATTAPSPGGIAGSASAPSTGVWYHLVGVDDVAAGAISLYLNGVLQSTVPYTGGWQANGATAVGRGYYGGKVDYVHGAIDDVQVFDSALSAGQVAALDRPASWPLTEGHGRTAADASGNGHALTLAPGANWATGRNGRPALALHGSADSYASTPGPVVNTAQPFSVSAWVKLNSAQDDQTFASIDGVNVSGFALEYTANTFAFATSSADSASATPAIASATGPPRAGVWYHLVGVDAGGRISLYVNGILQSTVAAPGSWTATGSTEIGRGRYNGAPADFANAELQDVIFANHGLTSGEAQYLAADGIAHVAVDGGTTGPAVSPSLFGTFLEDINNSGEGGLYAQLVQNRDLKASASAPTSYAAVGGGSIALDTTNPLNSALDRSLKLSITGAGRAGFENTGFWGIPVNPRERYSASFFARSDGFSGPLTVDIESTSGTVYASATVTGLTSAWQQFTVPLTTSAAAPASVDNVFVVSTSSAAAGQHVWFDNVSLLPPTYENKPAALRVDLMRKLAALHPAFFRVPGGNYLEGNTFATRFDWSTTVGPDYLRPGHQNTAWNYWSTDGLGLDEYLQMAEELGASPVLAVYAGYSLDGETQTGSTLDSLATDAVNELHYALDPVSTGWGRQRAANGHAAPYRISYVEIGNEDWFTNSYNTRYPVFYNAIHAAFPNLRFIATATETAAPYDVIDDHFYQSPGWFESNSHYYDTASRTGPKVFVGEYASQEGRPTPDMDAAEGDASWLLGLERNSDLVIMSSYAPLLVNVNNDEWATNLIGFNGLTSYGSPTYYAQEMLATQHGANVVPTTQFNAGNLQIAVTRTAATGDTYLTVVNTGGTAQRTAIDLAGLHRVTSEGTATVLSAATSLSTNSITDPNAIVPRNFPVSNLGNNFDFTFAGNSITILRFQAK